MFLARPMSRCPSACIPARFHQGRPGPPSRMRGDPGPGTPDTPLSFRVSGSDRYADRLPAGQKDPSEKVRFT
ncbi:hypothetical protein ATO3_17705 [Marinibacterium profundimaris]|uniref:Uncharacterized protein n=1 Tax=Marinibacterium profundimaris TaxID=1679460 RepID=A0A225NF94_9RHOB|nr:hypothetical protein ATO3_17705 [Marinibacterium profundimaris]